MTPAEWRMRERLQGVQDSEDEWLACPAADCLLARLLKRGVSEYKLRLFGCACCRLVWQHLVHPESRAAVEAAEKFAEGKISAADLLAAQQAASAVVRNDKAPRSSDPNRRREYVEHISALSAAEIACAEHQGGWPYWERLVEVLVRVVEAARYHSKGLDEGAMEAALCDRLREIFGNPYREVPHTE